MEEKEPITTTSETGTGVTDVNTNALSALKDLKENSVPKSLYEALLAQNRELINDYINGTNQDENATEVVRTDDELRTTIFEDEAATNLDKTIAMLELRSSVMKKGGRDIFLPYGDHVSPTDVDVEAANRLASAFEHCIEVAAGNPDVFNNELQRITVESRRFR